MASTQPPRTARQLWQGIEAVDRAAVRQRIARLKRENRGVPLDRLHQRLVYAKCVQAGAVGAITELTGFIPLIGRLAGPVLGPLADAALVTTLQAELVAETFALYGVDLPESSERMAVFAIAATNIGANVVGARVVAAVASQAARVVGGTIARRALPFASIATVAATNVAVTYATGMRAQALCRMRDATIDDWPELLSKVTMIDTRKLTRLAASSASAALVQAGEVSRALLSRLRDLAPTGIFPAPEAVRSTGTRRSTEVKSRPAAARKPPKKAAARKPAKKAAARKPAAKTAPRKAAPKSAVKTVARKRAPSARRKPSLPK